MSTRSADGVPNLAPFSYFSALSATPFLVGVSIGHRRGPDAVLVPKDSLANVRARGAFCVNVVDEDHLDAMNASSIDAPPGIDEFAWTALPMAEAATVDAPTVADAPAVLECRLWKEVDLGGANTLVIGEVRAVRLAVGLPRVEGTLQVDASALRPVGRLSGSRYSLTREIVERPRPYWGEGSGAGG